MQANPQSFIIKFWIEEAPGSYDQLVWHGLVTHVPSGARSYLKSADDLLNFMAPHLKAMRIEFIRPAGLWRRLRRWVT